MISPSLRKPRTTLSSTIREITADWLPQGRQRLLRLTGVSLCGLALLTGWNAASAEEWKARPKRQPTAASTDTRTALPVSYQTESAAGTAAAQPVVQPPAVTPQLVPPAEPQRLPGTDAPSLAAGVTPSLQSAIDRGSCSSLDAAPQTWSEYYSARMQSLLQGDGSADQSLGTWWHDNSAAFRYRNQHLVRSTGQLVGVNVDTVGPQLKAGLRQHIAEHTLPPDTGPAVDVYETRPRVTELGPVRTVSDQQDKADSRVARLTRDITAIQPTLNYALKGISPDQLPADFHDKMDNGEYVARQSSPTVMQWAPTNMYHHPLYFEDPALERYGHTYHPLVQPFASTGRFATQLVGLPYQMTLHPVHAREYTLGYYRPGDWAPKKTYQIPFNEEATLMQAAVVAGLILIIP